MSLIYRQSVFHPTIQMAFAPALTGIKQKSVPLAFQTIHTADRAGYAAKFAGLMILGRRRERIGWVENKIYSGVSGSIRLSLNSLGS